MLLAGQKVVVVGGSSGIGLSTAELAKSEGADVTIASRNAERLKATAEKLGVKSMPAGCVTSDESVAQLFQQCGVVNHVVSLRHNCAPARSRPYPWKTSVRPWRRSSGVPGASRVRVPKSSPGGCLHACSGFLSVHPRPAAGSWPRQMAPWSHLREVSRSNWLLYG